MSHKWNVFGGGSSCFSLAEADAALGSHAVVADRLTAKQQQRLCDLHLAYQGEWGLCVRTANKYDREILVEFAVVPD